MGRGARPQEREEEPRRPLRRNHMVSQNTIPMPAAPSDIQFMRHALALAWRGAGRTWPNPSVGCVIVRIGPDGSSHVAGRGWTAPGGRPHAETLALQQTGAAARGGTAYVTLEPCAHQGHTPSCARALADAGIGRVVCALADPDSRVNGRGFALLREAGVEVVTGVCAQEARRAAAGFLMRIEKGRPLVTLKLATSLDGRIATASGRSQWITGEDARAWGHLLRARHDAILVGGGTALADDPALTCRLPGLEDRSPVRVVMDGRLRLPASARMLRDAREAPVWIITRAGHGSATCDALRQTGAELIELEGAANAPLDEAATLGALAARGVTRLLIEGGAALATAFWRAGLVDRVVWFRAPIALGGDGRPSLEALSIGEIAEARRLRRTALRVTGDDVVEWFDIER